MFMEQIVHSYLMKFLESNKILCDFQHGFRKRRSCETQRITTIYGLAIGLDRWQQVDALLLDFCKAFGLLIRFKIIAWQSNSITIASETRTYPGSNVSLHIHVRINKLSLMGRYLLLQLSHLEFHRVQYSELSCSWYKPMTCPQEFSLRYDLLLIVFYCTELFGTRRMHSHFQ